MWWTASTRRASVDSRRGGIALRGVSGAARPAGTDALELSERKLIDQAKALPHQADGASESEVYREMRKTAMDRSMKLADIARQILQRPLV